MRTDRLSQLADHLETVDEDKFDMESWGNGIDPNECGFEGCAAGHAVALFAKEGLTLKKAQSGIQPVFGFLYGFAALEGFFVINSQTTSYIFAYSAYDPDKQTVTLSMVAQRIREVLLNNHWHEKHL